MHCISIKGTQRTRTPFISIGRDAILTFAFVWRWRRWRFPIWLRFFATIKQCTYVFPVGDRLAARHYAARDNYGHVLGLYIINVALVLDFRQTNRRPESRRKWKYRRGRVLFSSRINLEYARFQKQARRRMCFFDAHIRAPQGALLRLYCLSENIYWMYVDPGGVFCRDPMPEIN